MSGPPPLPGSRVLSSKSNQPPPLAPALSKKNTSKPPSSRGQGPPPLPLGNKCRTRRRVEGENAPEPVSTEAEAAEAQNITLSGDLSVDVALAMKVESVLPTPKITSLDTPSDRTLTPPPLLKGPG